MFEERRFAAKATTVDKRGRPRPQSSKDDLKK
jgi:hypothetical protein